MHLQLESWDQSVLGRQLEELGLFRKAVGAAIMSTLAGIGGIVGGGAIAGTAIVAAAPVAAAAAIGYGIYKLFGGGKE